LREIYPIARPKIDPQFAHAIANGLYVSEVPQRYTPNTGKNAKPRFLITQLK